MSQLWLCCVPAEQNVETNERKPLAFELRKGGEGEGEETDLYKDVMSRVASSWYRIFMIVGKSKVVFFVLFCIKYLLCPQPFRKVPGATGATSPQNKLLVGDNDSGVEDEDLSPRPSPNPHPAGEQVSTSAFKTRLRVTAWAPVMHVCRAQA